ncbi:MAG: MBOAT family O-acyltransferase [Erysipelotrichaceae bacterium]
MSFDNRMFCFLLFTIISTYITARMFDKYPIYKRITLITCIILNIGILFIVKYYGYIQGISGIIFKALGLTTIDSNLNILVPIGISYYTLQTISYITDVYQGKIKSEKNIFKFSLYITWFPCIIQGPISRFDQLSKQLISGHDFSYSRTVSSLQLVLFGLIKKLIIADQLAIIVNYCYGNCASLEGFVLYIGAVAFSMQLYMDFSGCVDICRGVSNLFGIKIINNFDAPYFSKSIKEFWSRWHISLSLWLRDYIYIPLGGNRKSRLRKNLNLSVTFLISGMWHGAGLGFIVWGSLHAFFQIFGERTLSFRKRIKKKIGLKENSVSDKFLRTIITFNLITFAWIFFRAGSSRIAISYIMNMITNFNPWNLFDGTIFCLGLGQNLLYAVIINMMLILIIEYQRSFKNVCFRKNLKSLHVVLRWPIYAAMIYDILIFGAYGTGYTINGFLYGGF